MIRQYTCGGVDGTKSRYEDQVKMDMENWGGKSELSGNRREKRMMKIARNNKRF